MRTRNYQQARRSREEARKSRQKQKLERKLNRGAAPETPADPAPPAAGKGEEDVP